MLGQRLASTAALLACSTFWRQHSALRIIPKSRATRSGATQQNASALTLPLMDRSNRWHSATTLSTSRERNQGAARRPPRLTRSTASYAQHAHVVKDPQRCSLASLEMTAHATVTPSSTISLPPPHKRHTRTFLPSPSLTNTLDKTLLCALSLVFHILPSSPPLLTHQRLLAVCS